MTEMVSDLHSEDVSKINPEDDSKQKGQSTSFSEAQKLPLVDEEVQKTTDSTLHSSAEEEDEEEESPQKIQNGKRQLSKNQSNTLLESGKRQRVKVKRLSETWNDAHVEAQSKKAKQVEEHNKILSSANGTSLGDIPRIESAIRKAKPVDLKCLHAIIYSRPGSVNEIRSNLRKFRGFSFTSGSSPEYDKKINQIKLRSTKDIRDCLRLLSLEVSGSQDQLAIRLLDFLRHPSSSAVKYKGKLNSSSSSSKSTTGKKRGRPKKAAAAASQASTTSEAVGDESADDHDSSSSSSPVDSSKGSAGKKRPRQESDDEDDDAPLTSLTKTAAEFPSDKQLKTDVSDLLAGIDLEQASLKVVREKIFARYPKIDLSRKKEFINDAVKEIGNKSRGGGEETRRYYPLHDDNSFHHPAKRRNKWYQSTLVLLLVLTALCYVGWRLLFATSRPSPIDPRLLDAGKCPACFGQSACPLFVNTQIRLVDKRHWLLSLLFGGEAGRIENLKQQSSVADVFEAHLGANLHDPHRQVHLRRHSSNIIDQAVCNRGAGREDQELVNSTSTTNLPCLSRLAVWRWMPTTDPDLVEQPLSVSDVAASPSTTGRLELAPATRCASQRLFDRLRDSFRERTSYQAATRWLRFDELTFLFNLAIDPTSLLNQAFPTSQGWPFADHIGACGRWIVESRHGTDSMCHYAKAPLTDRLRLLANFLALPARLERDGFVVYLTDLNLASSFTIDVASWKVSVVELKKSIVVDRLALLGQTDGVASWYNVTSTSTNCTQSPEGLGDAGGPTPSCIEPNHADALCRHTHSDHNQWAICSALLATNSECVADLLTGIPAALRLLIEQCTSGQGQSRQESIKAALRLIDSLL